MKKTLVLMISVMMVLSLTTAALALEATYEGALDIIWSGDTATTEDASGFGIETLELELNFDVAKEFSENTSAGLTVQTYFDNDDYGDAYFSSELYILNTNAWIKFDYDLFDVTVFTNDKGAVGNDFTEFSLKRAAGVKAVVTPFKGLSLTGLVNNGGANGYGFLAKGEYANDLFTLGAGFQSERGGDKDSNGDFQYNKDFSNRTALAVYGSINVLDSLTVKAEYGSRVLGTAADQEAITGILAGAKFDNGKIMLDGNFLKLDNGFVIIDYYNDGSKWLARDQVKNNVYGDASVVFVDASFAVLDALKVVGNFDYILNAKIKDSDQDYDFDAKKENISYKAGLVYQFSDALKGEGWYRAIGEDNQIGVKASYTFADGLVGSFQVTNSSATNDRITAYKAMVSATF